MTRDHKQLHPRREQDPLHRTVMCRYFIERNGKCPYGNTCKYAHGVEQIRQVSKRELQERVLQDRLCHEFLFDGACNYSNGCRYQHRTFDQITAKDGPKMRPPKDEELTDLLAHLVHLDIL